MGDLISRSAMLRHFSDWQMECLAVGSEREYNLFDMAIKGIKNEPSAFDVEKVIQQLEEKISSYELCVETAVKEIDKNPQNASTFEVCSLHNNRGYLNGLKRALEIVKSVGIDVGQKGGV